MSKTAWVGIDVSKDSFYAAVADDAAVPRQWAGLPQASFEHTREGLTQFVGWLRELGWTKKNLAGICLEATGQYSSLWVRLLKGRLTPASIVNPARPKAYASSLGIRDKTDRVDACVIALYAKTTQPDPAPAESSTQLELRELSRVHRSLYKEFQANRQRLDASVSRSVRASLKVVVSSLRRQLRRLEEAMSELICADQSLSQDFQRATTIQGIGPKTATIILAEFGDLRRYKRDQLVALAGLYPREHTSGTSVRKKARLAKAGRPSVRAALYMCAMSAIKSNPNLRRFAKRLEKSGKRPMQIIAAVMRKLLLLVRACIVSGTHYDPDYPHGVQSHAA